MRAEDFFNSTKPNIYLDREFQIHAAKIGPGEYYVTQRDMMVVTVLGSCVSACLHDPVTRIGGMNHFMLPKHGGDPESPLSSSARYGAFAMEVLINHLLGMGARRDKLVAKVFGAGRVLSGITDIGARNAQFALDYMKREKIPVLAEDLGDIYPRKVYFYAQTGRVLVKILRTLNNDTILTREKDYAQHLDSTSVAGEVDLFQ